MSTDEVIAAIHSAVKEHRGDKLELYDRLSDLGTEWVEKHNHLVDLLDNEDDEDDSTIEYQGDK